MTCACETFGLHFVRDIKSSIRDPRGSYDVHQRQVLPYLEQRQDVYRIDWNYQPVHGDLQPCAHPRPFRRKSWPVTRSVPSTFLLLLVLLFEVRISYIGVLVAEYLVLVALVRNIKILEVRVRLDERISWSMHFAFCWPSESIRGQWKIGLVRS